MSLLRQDCTTRLPFIETTFTKWGIANLLRSAEPGICITLPLEMYDNWLR